MKIRTTCPKNNKYYIRQVTGGLNGAVAGKPTQKGANVLDNCVGYANGRFNEIWNDPDLKGISKTFPVQLVCNAENFIESAKKQGLTISSTPIEGGIMVWQKGKTLSSSDGAGHVAVVEEVYDDGSILTSESGWNSWAFKLVRRDNSNGRWGQASAYKFRGCIKNPSVKNPKVVPAPKLTVDGVGGYLTVMAAQRLFGTPADGVYGNQRKDLIEKYAPSLKAVEYGKSGSVGVKAIQKWLGITQDGVWGKATSKALQEALTLMGYVVGSIDGIFGTKSMKAFQQFLNEHDTLPPCPKKVVDQNETPQEKACAWGRKIADDNSYHYVKYTSNEKTHECPICKNHPKGKFHGWNCIGFAWACWRHGAGIKCKCNNHVIDNACAEKILKASDANALKIVKEKSGLNDVKVIRNNGDVIPQSKLKAGDICMNYKGKTYQHTFLYLGNGKMVDAQGSSGKISNNNQIKVRKAVSAKVAIRYTGK